MPATITGLQPGQTFDSIFSEANGNVKAALAEEYKVNYPVGVDLRPGKPMHEALKNYVLTRAQDSARYLSQKHPKMRDIDHMCNVFIEKDEEESRIKSKDSRKPVSIVISEMFATRDTFLTYLLAVYGSDPLWQLSPVGPEDAYGCILLEKVVQSQVQRNKVLLGMMQLFSNAITYGFGAATVNWSVKEGKKVMFEDLGYIDLFGNFNPTGSQRTVVDAVLSEGSAVGVIDPYCFLPDPAVPLHCTQEGDFVGWKTTGTYLNKRRAELERDSYLFNTQYLQGKMGRSSIYPSDQSGRNPEITISSNQRWTDSQLVDDVWMYIDIIPYYFQDASKTMRLGESKNPETWLVCVSNDEVVTCAHPVERIHEKFNVFVCVPDVDGHGFIPTSRLEHILGPVEVINFEFNSHIYFIRKLMKNPVIFDPKSVNSRDVLSGSPYIRTRKSVWGRGVKDVMEQLKLTDPTQNFMNDMEQTRGLGRNISGAVDSLQGLQRSGGERVTKAEFEQTRGAAVSRLQKMARMMSIQCVQDVGAMFCKNTQRFMQEETYVRTVGRWEQTLRAEYGILDPQIKVNPFDLNIDFDVDISDGTIAGSEGADIWTQLFQIISAQPELIATFDMPRILMHIARMQGAKNVEDFIRKTPQVNANVMPQEQFGDASNSSQYQQLGAE